MRTVVIIDLVTNVIRPEGVWKKTNTYNNQISKLEMTSNTGGFASNAFHQTAIAAKYYVTLRLGFASQGRMTCHRCSC